METIYKFLTDIQQEKGNCLADCIEDNKLYLMKKIYTLLDSHAKQVVQSILDKTYIDIDNHNPIIT